MTSRSRSADQHRNPAIHGSRPNRQRCKVGQRGQSGLDTISTMTELRAKVRNFFDHYQWAMADSEVERMAALYANVFLFGDPAGVRLVSKEDFIRVLPRRKEFFASAGLT